MTVPLRLKNNVKLHKNMTFFENESPRTCVNMREYTTSQGSIVWCNTFIYFYSHTELENNRKNSAARKNYTGRWRVKIFTFFDRIL